MKKDFHTLCSRRTGTKLELVAKHGRVIVDIQLMLAFDPTNK